MVDILKLRKMNKDVNEKNNVVQDQDVQSSTEQNDLVDLPKVEPNKAENEPESPTRKMKKEQVVESETATPSNDQKPLSPEQPGIEGASKDSDQKVIDLVVFTLADRLFGVDIIKVQEVVRFTEITRVPNAAEFILGVMNLRGNITPVIDLHKRFALKEVTWTDKTRIIVLQINNQAIGFLVDYVSEIMHAYENDIESTTGAQTNIGTDYISGVVKIRDSQIRDNVNKLLILLNLENVFDEGTVTLN